MNRQKRHLVVIVALFLTSLIQSFFVFLAASGLFWRGEIKAAGRIWNVKVIDSCIRHPIDSRIGRFLLIDLERAGTYAHAQYIREAWVSE